MSEFKCPRCIGPRPANFADDRNCAFDSEGNFTPDNWNCGTVSALLQIKHEEVLGSDERMEIIPVIEDMETNGWVVLTRYKSRGCTSSAVYVGDFWPSTQLTLDLAASMILKATN